jgi:hypothetical protein
MTVDEVGFGMLRSEHQRLHCVVDAAGWKRETGMRNGDSHVKIKEGLKCFHLIPTLTLQWCFISQ